MHIVILNEQGEVLKDENGNDIVFYNIQRPNHIFTSYVKPNYVGAFSWKEKIVNESSEEVKQQLRDRRNRLLNDCDWTQIADADITTAQKNEWKVYRKALRDLTETDFIGPIIWPVAPDGSV